MGLKYTHGLTFVHSILGEYYKITADVQSQLVADRDIYVVKTAPTTGPPSEDFLPTVLSGGTFFMITPAYIYYVKPTGRTEVTLTMYKDV